MQQALAELQHFLLIVRCRAEESILYRACALMDIINNGAMVTIGLGPAEGVIFRARHSCSFPTPSPTHFRSSPIWLTFPTVRKQRENKQAEDSRDS